MCGGGGFWRAGGGPIRPEDRGEDAHNAGSLYIISMYRPRGQLGGRRRASRASIMCQAPARARWHRAVAAVRLQAATRGWRSRCMGQPSPSALNAKSPLALNAEAPSFKPTSPMRKSALRADAPIFEPCPSPVRQSRPATGVDSPASASRLSPGAREALKAELRKLATHASQDSYVGSELRECDARGFMAAGALLWCKEADGVEGVALLMAEERRRPGGPTQLNFLGGKRDAVNESAGATAAREIGEETGELMSEATRAAIRAAKGPVVWDRQGSRVERCPA